MSFPLERRQEKCEGAKDNELGMGMTHHPQNTCIRYGMSVSGLPGIESRVRTLDLGPITTYKIMYKLNPTYFRTISHVSVANRGLIIDMIGANLLATLVLEWRRIFGFQTCGQSISQPVQP